MLRTLHMQYVMVVFALCFAGGHVAAVYLQQPYVFSWVSAGFLSIVLFSILYVFSRWIRTVLCVVSFCLGFFSYTWVHQKTWPAMCVDESQQWRVQIDSVFTRQPDHEKGMVRSGRVLLLYQRCGSVWKPYGASAHITLSERTPFVRGDVLQMQLNISDQKTILSKKNIKRGLFHRVFPLSSYVVVSPSESFLGRLDRMRDAVALSLEKALPLSQSSMAKALVLGDQSTVEEERREQWSYAGITHVISVSGLHMGVLALMMYWFCKKTIRYFPYAGERYSVQRMSSLFTCIGVVSYTGLIGFQSAAVRACIMTCVWLVSKWVGRRSFVWNAWGFSAVCILLYDPHAISDPGFLLSFTGVAALALLPSQEDVLQQTAFQKMLMGLWSGFVSSVMACVFTASVSVYFFGTVSLIAPFSNMLAVPVASFLATPYAAFLCLCSMLFPHESAVFGFCAHVWKALLWFLDAVASWSASLPYAYVHVPKPYVYEYVVYGICVVGACLFLRVRHWKCLCAGVVLMCVCVGIRVYERCVGTGTLLWVQAYVGQGDGAVVVFPKGSVMVVDAGGRTSPKHPDPGKAVMARMLHDLNIHTIDTMVLTHPHPDHVGGLPWLAEHFRVKKFVYNGTAEAYMPQRKVMDAVQKTGGEVWPVAQMPHTYLLEGVEVRWFHAQDLASVSANNASVMVRMAYADKKVLLTGDIERETEEETGFTIGDIDVLKAPHHGSRTSSTEALLSFTHPKAVVVSCGAYNRFGFPHGEVLERYIAHGMRIFRTDEEGAVYTSINSKGVLEINTHMGDYFLLR